MLNPYQAPQVDYLGENEKIIKLLMHYQRQIAVVNVLTAEGMSDDKAAQIVHENTSEAQKRLNRKQLPWYILSYFFLMSFITSIFACIVMDIFGLIPVSIVVSSVCGCVFCFQNCSVIRP